MKKWTKTALLTGCACCIAGAVLMFSGWASGGKAYAETYDLNAMSGSAKKEEGISTQEKIKLDDFDELQADLTIGDLNILPSGDDSCYLAWRIPSKKGETAVEYRVRDGVLSIEETSAVSDTIYINIDFTEEILSGGKQSETGVILYVPENLRKMSNVGNVVLVEQTALSTYQEVEKEIKIIAEQGAMLIGGVTVDTVF